MLIILGGGRGRAGFDGGRVTGLGLSGFVQPVVAIDGAVDFGVRKFEPIGDGIKGDTVGQTLLSEQLGFFHSVRALGVAFLLQLAELVYVALHVAMDALFVEREEVQFAGVVEEGLGVGEGVADFAAIAVTWRAQWNLRRMRMTPEREDVVLHGADAVETPGVLGDRLRKLLFERRFGVEAGNEASAESIVSFAVLAGKDGHLTRQTVTKIVAAGAGFTLFASGTCGMEGVAAIRFELLR